MSQPLTVKCETIRDVRKFLSGCHGVSDKEQFGKDDYWQRQFLAMGYDARFVVGRSGRYGIGHAWVTFQKDGKSYLVEPQLWPVGETFPRLSTIRYHPRFSVAWDGERLAFYSHKDLAGNFKPWQLPVLVFDWIIGWGFFWFLVLSRLPLILWRLALWFIRPVSTLRALQ
jgi:hypothetical protein